MMFNKLEEITMPKTILCIPGKWNDRSEIVSSIVKNNDKEFIFAGNILLNLRTKKGFELEICNRDPGMKEAFKWAGMVNQVSEKFLNEIDEHECVIYLSAETGDIENAKAIAEAGNAILKSGGIGIKVETAGKAFTKEQWNQFLSDYEEANLYQMFVLDSISDGEGKIYSCGMHNLGLKDSIVSGEEPQDAVNLISIFNQYQLIEKPKIKNNQTFSVEEDAPLFEISDEKHQPNEGDELFENPYGMWKLERKGRQ